MFIAVVAPVVSSVFFFPCSCPCVDVVAVPCPDWFPLVFYGPPYVFQWFSWVPLRFPIVFQWYLLVPLTFLNFFFVFA